MPATLAFDDIARQQVAAIFDAQKTERETVAAVKAEYPSGPVRVFMKSTQREHEFGFENALRAILRGDATLIKKGK